jgi:hypothetical protein
MQEPRRFTRLRPGPVAPGQGLYTVPEAGLCLSTFVVIRPLGRDREVLFGKIDPRADWAEIGALDPRRAERVASSWMLPSSQLLFFEAPLDSARRIAREQLGTDLPPPERFSVHSEAYRRAGESGGDPHWDLHFVFLFRWPDARAPRADPWKELRFVDLDGLSPESIARSQGDVLALVGLAPGGGAGPVRPSAPGRTRRP